jgi:hypothetical protein
MMPSIPCKPIIKDRPLSGPVSCPIGSCCVGGISNAFGSSFFGLVGG